jgi:hypothetical protein
LTTRTHRPFSFHFKDITTAPNSSSNMNRDFATQLAPPSSSLEQRDNARTSGSGGDRMTPLSIDFVPTQDDVICGRGKKCYNHIGNELFRRRVVSMLGEYRKTRSKLEKSKVLNDVVEQVRRNSPLGGFVKQDESGRWYEVGDFLAREKTSQAFRDALHDNYKSSNVAKKKRRQEEQSKSTTVKASKLARSDFDIFKSMDKLTSSMARICKFRRCGCCNRLRTESCPVYSPHLFLISLNLR